MCNMLIGLGIGITLLVVSVWLVGYIDRKLDARKSEVKTPNSRPDVSKVMERRIDR